MICALRLANGEVGSVCVEPSDATISAATLIADGTTDRLDPVATDYALAQLIRGVRLKLYRGGGHALFAGACHVGTETVVDHVVGGALP